MSFIEFIGFVISFAAMIFLVIRRFFEERQRRLNPEEFARQEKLREENLRRFLKSRDIYSGEEEDDEEEFEEELRPVVPKKYNKPVPPPKPAILQQQAFVKLREAQKQQALQQKATPPPVVHQGNYGAETAREKRRSHAASDDTSYEVIRVERVTAANKLLSSLKSPQDMLVIKEIFDKPLSMRSPQD